MRKLVLRPSAFLLLTAVGLLCITSIGGCPSPQTPTTPADDDDSQSTQPFEPATDDGLDRPITPPDLDDETTTSDDGTTSGGSTPTSGGEEVDFVLLAISQPSDDIAVAIPPRVTNGAAISLLFNLTDTMGSVVKGELLLARDDDENGQPDGAPVYVQETAIFQGSNVWYFDTDTAVAKGLLTNHFGRFVLGARITTASGDVIKEYSPATILLDGVAPEWTWNGAGPSLADLDMEDHLVGSDTSWTLSLDTDDNSPHTWKVMVDMDQTPGNGNEFEFVPETDVPAGAGTHTPPDPISLSVYPTETYYYYVIVADEVDPPVARYVQSGSGELPRLSITNRLIGEFELEQLKDEPPVVSQSKGAIMQGFNFNDLAGSSMVSVPDLDGDGDSELIIGARFGKPNLSSFSGTGWGEAYLIYGDGSMRLTGENELNSIGGGIPGLTFRGIRTPQNTDYTKGLSDVTVIEDMDGDDLPELVFSFPRVESLSLKSPTPFQHPDLIADISGSGNLEYDAVAMTMMGPVWVPNTAQFTRGGIVIVSSHNELLTDPGQVTRKFDRVLDLHEVGQMFSWMTRPSVAPYIFDLISLGAGYCTDCAEWDPDVPDELPPCDGEGDLETEFSAWLAIWDVWLGGG